MDTKIEINNSDNFLKVNNFQKWPHQLMTPGPKERL